MATLDQVNSLLVDVSARLNAMSAPLTAEQIKSIFQAHLQEALADPDLGRKLKFGKESPAALQGTKFARWNLGVADVEFLYDLQTALAGQRKSNGAMYQGPSTELTNVFKSISDARYIDQDTIRKIDRNALDDLYPRISKSREAEFEKAVKAMDSAESGYGSQLVGAQYVADLWEVSRRESRIFNLLNSFEMTAPTAYLPVEVDFPEMQFVAENTANNSSEYGTTKTGSQRVAVTAAKFVLHQMWSGELEEDAIIPFIPFLRMQAGKGIAHYSDSLVLNGDTTNAGTGNINLDDADPADTKHYLAFDGIRHAGLIDNTANSADAGGAISWNLLSRQRGRMVDSTRFVDWGHDADPKNVVYVTDVDTSDRIAELDEVKTLDKYGDKATVLTGEVAQIGRNPLLVSMASSKTEADGKVSTTGGNNTKGQVTCFNRRAFVVGWRRRVKLEVERLPARDQTRIVYSLRLGMGRFTPTGAASGIEGADVLYNISL